MTGQCSELILLIWSVWSGYRAIRVLYLPSCTIPSSLSQCSVSPSLSLTINNITTSDNHTASYRTSHTHFSSARNPRYRLLLQPSDTSLPFFQPIWRFGLISIQQGTMVDFKLYSVISLRYQKYRLRQKQNISLEYGICICHSNSNLR